MPSFDEILSKPTVFLDRDALSPNYIPEILPFREKEIEKIMKVISPALNDQQPHNLFIYGKTGTGKTASVKHVMVKFIDMGKETAKMCYVNCRMYNTRYRVVQKIAKTFMPELNKSGFGGNKNMNIEEYIDTMEMEEIDALHEPADMYIKPIALERVEDVDVIIDELKKGNIVLLNVSRMIRWPSKLKNCITSLKTFSTKINGDMPGVVRIKFNVRVVLVEPEFPINIGSVARVMANFGFDNLYLVKPKALDDTAYMFAEQASQYL